MSLRDSGLSNTEFRTAEGKTSIFALQEVLLGCDIFFYNTQDWEASTIG